MSTVLNDALKNEFIMDIDDFQQTKTISGLYSFVRLVQILCILQPGSYPNNPSMGIGISNYKFEFMDSDTLGALRTRILEQITKYLPNNLVSNIDLKTDDLSSDSTVDNGKQLVIMISIYSNASTQLTSAAVTFENQKNGKLLSKIFF